MGEILQNINPASISAAIDASMITHKSFLCTSSRGQLHQEPDLLWTESNLVNAVLYTNLQQDTLPTTVERIRNHFALRTALSIALYYGIEQELKDSIDQSYHVKIDEGYINDSLS
ncbi:hypothetical protein ccbrp13_10630 [Ktedonobacteria bacterium brp13]|nr:hypothetical protein ccbrp13_10630 [Ktedonobacteria bacterium brp13]